MLVADFTIGYETVTIYGLTQWDKGQKLQITGIENLPTTFQVHFANYTLAEAIIILGNTMDGVGVVDIPNSLLEQDVDFKAYVYVYDVDSSETIKTIQLPVVRREKPSDFISVGNENQIILEQVLTDIQTEIDENYTFLEGRNSDLQQQLIGIASEKANQSDLNILIGEVETIPSQEYITNKALQADLILTNQEIALKADQTDFDATNAAVALKADKSEVTNVMTPKGNIAHASLPMTGNAIGWYYYCSDGDGIHGAGNYVWNGTLWYFGGTGDEGYSKLKSDLGEKASIKKIDTTATITDKIIALDDLHGYIVPVNAIALKNNIITNKNQLNKTYNGVTISYDTDGNIILNGTSTTSWNNTTVLDAVTPAIAGKNIKLKVVLENAPLNLPTFSVSFRIGQTYGNVALNLTLMEWSGNIVSTTGNEITITFPANYTFINTKVKVYLGLANVTIPSAIKTGKTVYMDEVYKVDADYIVTTDGNPFVCTYGEIVNVIYTNDITKSRWNGKKIVFWGDSMTWYDNQTYLSTCKSEWVGKICKGYQQTVQRILDCTYTTKGYSGKTSIYICNLIKQYDFSNDDIIVLGGGVNDYIVGCNIGTIQPIGATFDTNTSYGAWQSAIEYILTNYPSKKLYITTPVIAWSGINVLPKNIAQIKKDVAELYKIPCFDAYELMGINVVNRDYYYADDVAQTQWRLHLNDNGNLWFGEMVSNFIMAN